MDTAPPATPIEVRYSGHEQPLGTQDPAGRDWRATAKRPGQQLRARDVTGARSAQLFTIRDAGLPLSPGGSAVKSMSQLLGLSGQAPAMAADADDINSESDNEGVPVRRMDCTPVPGGALPAATFRS